MKKAALKRVQRLGVKGNQGVQFQFDVTIKAMSLTVSEALPD